MNRAESPAPPALRLKELLCGAALAALAAFCAHRFEAGGSGTVMAVNLAALVIPAAAGGARLLAGRFSGGSGGVRPYLGLALLTAAAWMFLLPAAWWPLSLVLGGVVCLSFSLAAWRRFLPRPPSTVLLGLGGGVTLAFLSVGLPAAVGVEWPMLLLLACGAAALTSPAETAGGAEEPEGRWSSARDIPFYVLSAALGMVMAAALRGYAHGAHIALYSVTDIGVAALLGFVLARFFSLHTLLDRRPAAYFGALAVVLLALAVHTGYMLYPDLIMSEPAAAQTPDGLDTLLRTFPLLVAALAGGALAGAVPWRRPGLAMLACAGGAGAGALCVAAGFVRAAGIASTLSGAAVMGLLLRDAEFRR